MWGGTWLVAMALVDNPQEALIYLAVATVMLGLMNLLPMREGMKEIVPVPPGPVVSIGRTGGAWAVRRSPSGILRRDYFTAADPPEHQGRFGA